MSQNLIKATSTFNYSGDMKGTALSLQDLQTRFYSCVLEILQSTLQLQRI